MSYSSGSKSFIHMSKFKTGTVEEAMYRFAGKNQTFVTPLLWSNH